MIKETILAEIRLQEVLTIEEINELCELIASYDYDTAD